MRKKSKESRGSLLAGTHPPKELIYSQEDSLKITKQIAKAETLILLREKMNKPIVIAKQDLKPQPFLFGGTLRRIIYPNTVDSVNLFMGIAEADPGTSPHRWHTHTRDSSEEYEIIYPEGFEEFYYILRGKGTIQWKMADGEIHEEPVDEGDTIYLPRGVPEHQLLNTGEDRLVVLYGGTPTSRWVKKSP